MAGGRGGVHSVGKSTTDPVYLRRWGMGGRDIQAAKGGGVFTRWGGYGPGVAEGGLGRDVFGWGVGKVTSLVEREGAPEARRVRASVWTSVKRQLPRDDPSARTLPESRTNPRTISPARRILIYNIYKFSSGG